MYVTDTGVLINCWHFWYAPEHHPTFWNGLLELASQNRFGFPEQVYIEIQEQDDDVSQWCRKNIDQLILPSDNRQEELYNDLVAQFPALATGRGRRQNYADLYVIAAAEVFNATAISTEKRDGARNPNKIKIPTACQLRGVHCIQPYEMLRREGWEFKH
ncbi:MAG: DUF4411 family protein [Balneolales bacterium]